MSKRSVLGPVVAMLAAGVLLGACGGSKAPASGSASPASATSRSSLGTPVVVFGGFLKRYTPQGGALKGRTQPGAYVTIHATGGSVLFVVRTVPKTADFQRLLYALPQLQKVPIGVAVKTTYGFKTFYVRPSKPLTPGPYQLCYGGAGVFQMALYESGAS